MSTSTFLRQMEPFLGKWNLLYTDGFDKYWAELGESEKDRNLRNTAKTNITIKKNCDTFTIKTESTYKILKFSFRLGEKFEQITIDGRKTQALITLDDNNVLTQVQQWDGKESTITWKVVDGILIIECAFNGVKCICIFKKV